MNVPKLPDVLGAKTVNQPEYIFGKATDTSAYCRRMGWRERGRAAWVEPDGPVVLFTCFIEQLRE